LTYQSCENNPNDVGQGFLPTIDTTGLRFLDSEADTMNITNQNYKSYVTDFVTAKFMVGRYQDYESKTLLKFTNIGVDFDSATVVSSILKLKYSNYFFKDKMGNTDFDIYQALEKFNFTTVKFDSINSSNIGNVSLGSYSGVVNDSQSIDITINNQIVKDWLEYAADTNHAVKNYGVLLQPRISSSTIKGFYSSSNGVELVPSMTVIYSKNNVLDTLLLDFTEFASMSDAPASVIPAEHFLLQNGVAYRNIMNFDLSKLPPNVIINNATLEFTLDNSLSYITDETDKSIVIGMVIDSVTKTDSIFTPAFLSDTIVYSISLNSVFQRWNSGVMPNLGITLKNAFEVQNLDNFAIYSSAYSDPTKRPRLKITYTPRLQ